MKKAPIIVGKVGKRGNRGGESSGNSCCRCLYLNRPARRHVDVVPRHHLSLMGLIQNLLLRFTLFYLSLPLPKDSQANVPSATNTAGDATDVVFEIFDWIRIYSDGSVERLVGTDVVPPSFDLATGVVSKDAVIDSSIGLSARLYLPVNATAAGIKLPILIYFHGGAFCIESPFSPTFHPHLNNLSSLGPLLAVSVNYSLAPEHPLPAAYEDSWAALQWVLSRADPWLASRGDFRRLYIAGDSAGANICHNLAMRAGEEGLVAIKGMALAHPFFTGKEPVGSELEYVKFQEGIDRIWHFVCPSTTGLDDQRANPVSETAPSLAALGCERVLVAVAGNDVLWSRGWLYYEKLRSSGWLGNAEIIDTPDAEHDFHVFHPETEKAAALTKSLAAFFATNSSTALTKISSFFKALDPEFSLV
ncbi:putative carboxylesterase 2 [Apostasia shenzhenica]|uniref:Putative carboxylesterase 2 n=1 Tax=Apostasia shenzhenica TaxID=1088818 RepID=A0A2I0A315_9ASPA|nr:putative carboxylesterase 2 [Apostasia shenzhenica]